MLYQITNRKTKEIKGTSNPIELKIMVLNITNDTNIASEVYEWATTPAFGSTRYDTEDFEIILIVQDE